MRSKARARKLAKSRFYFFPLLIAFSRRHHQTPGSVDVQCVLVICQILKRGGGDFSAKKRVQLRLLCVVPLHAGLLDSLVPGVRKFHV